MPTVHPTQYLFDAISQLTGGLIVDMQTLILGVVVCMFIMLGLEVLTDILAVAISHPGGSIAKLKSVFGSWRVGKLMSSGGEPGVRSAGGGDINLSPERYRDLEEATINADSWGEPSAKTTASNDIELSPERYRDLEEATINANSPWYGK